MTNEKVQDYLVLFFGVGIFVVQLIPASDSMIYKLFNLLFHNRLVFIVLGYFLSKIIRLITDKNKSKKEVIIQTILFVLVCGFSLTVLLKSYFWINTIYFIAVFAIMILCLFNKLKFLEWKPFQFIGSLSLWIYLLHQNIGYLIINAFNDMNLYWLGVVVAIITIGLICAIFGKGYNAIYNLIVNRIKKKNNNKGDSQQSTAND